MKLSALSATIALHVAACAYSVESPDVGVTEVAVVGGAATTEFPEVGVFAGPVGPCTATLIAPRAILTAAHCFNYNTDTSETAAGGWFMYNNANSQRMIKRYISLGSGEADLAVAELDTEISPSDGVTWRALASEYPRDGDPYTTVVGYSCANTVKDVYGSPYCDSSGDFSVKRAMDVLWHVFQGDLKISSPEIGQLVLTVTGDSGGPVLGPDGNILMVVSETDCDKRTVPVILCTEGFGTVPQNRSRITSAVYQLTNWL